MTGLAVDVEQRGLDGLLGDWERLCAAQPAATPFQSAGWARAWWPHWADGGEPYAVVVRDGEITVGLAALVRRRRAGIRLLEPVGIEPGDYWDVLAEPGRERAVADAVAGALAARAGEWDAWILRTVPPESALPGAVERAALRVPVRRPVPAPAVALPDSFDAYLAALPASRRQNLRRHLKRLDAGEVAVSALTDAERFPAFVERWRELRRLQWRDAGREIAPEHLSERFAAFMTDCLRELVPSGRALAWEFRGGGRDDVVGAYVNFVDGRAFYWYLGGFDPALARVGIGKIAIAHGIRTSIEAGRQRFDFTRGPEPYKYWYGARDRWLTTAAVGSPRPRSRAALAAVRALLALRDRRAGAGAGTGDAAE